MTTAAQTVSEFHTWRPGYGGSTVEIVRPGTNVPLDVFTDYALTVPADNPQVLLLTTIDGTDYGRFAQPVYVAEAYELEIDGVDRTGIVRPGIVSLNDEVADYAIVKTARGQNYRRLIDRFDDVIHVEDFGELGQSSSTNTATINAAIGAASGQGGGDVLIPAGTWPITTLTLSENVRLRGDSKRTTILQSQQATRIITLGGDRSGLIDITIDGVSLVASSIGVWAKAQDDVILRDCEIKRFAINMQCLGGKRHRWTDLAIVNGGIGVLLEGNSDALNGADGDEFAQLVWVGGEVTQCTTAGLKLLYEDRYVRANALVGVSFRDNTGTAVAIVGARATSFQSCEWTGNTKNLTVTDDTDASAEDENTVIGLTVARGRVSAGQFDMNGTCQDVSFERIDFAGNVTMNLTLPENPILWKDCTEGSSVTISGDATKLLRATEMLRGAASGRTTDGSTLTAISYPLAHGQVIKGRVIAIANARNAQERAVYEKDAQAHRPPATLNFDGQTANFTKGDLVTGNTSGATALLVDQADNGTTGTLYLRDVAGTFLDNENIHDEHTGLAVVNGALAGQNAALLGSVTNVSADYESAGLGGAALTLTVSGSNFEAQVTGVANITLDWDVKVDITT